MKKRKIIFGSAILIVAILVAQQFRERIARDGINGFAKSFAQQGSAQIAQKSDLNLAPPKAIGNSTIPVSPAVDISESKLTRTKSFLVAFSALDRKALRTSQEQRQLEDLISDQKNLDQVFLFLNSKQALDPKKLGEMMNYRMMAVDYLARAAESETNPIREDAIASIKNYLINESLEPLGDEKIKMAVAGDQVELYSVLSQASPATAKDLAHISRGTRLAKIIAIARGIYPHSSIENRGE